MHIVKKNMRWRSRFTDDRIFALVFMILFLILTLPRLFGADRIGAVNWGEYDATLLEVGLDYTPDLKDDPDRYYTHVVEGYQITSLDMDRLLQFRPTTSLVYPVTLAKLHCAVFGQVFSTQQLAAVYLLAIALSVFSLFRNAYRLWGMRALALALGLIFLFTGAEFMGWLNSLYEEGAILTGVFLYAAALFAAAVAQRGRWTCLIRLYLSGLFLSLTKEGVFLPVALFVLLSLAVMTAYHCPRGVRRLRYILISLALLAISGSVVLQYHLDSEVYENTAHRYDAVYGGLLTTAEDPAAEIAELGLPAQTVNDIGLSIYHEAEAYVVNPRTPEAQRLIFEKITVDQMASYYFRHPDRLVDVASAMLTNAGEYSTGRLMFVEPDVEGNPKAVHTQSAWNILRTFLAKSGLPFYAVLCGLFLAAGIAGCVFLKRGAAKPLAVLSLFSPGLLAALLFMQTLLYAFAYIDYSLFPLKLLFDWMLLFGLQFFVLAACRLGILLRDNEPAAIPPAPEPEPELSQERVSPVWSALARFHHSAWDWARTRNLFMPRRGALVFTALALIIIFLVLFLPPHIGVRNNGDYGRVMEDIGVYWQEPKDLDASFHTNIEDYRWIEADFSRLTLPNPGLAQVYMGSLMRLVSPFLGVEGYSTYWAAVGYAVILLACLYVLFRSMFVFFGIRRALLLNTLLLVALLGKMHLGWFNSLYGEGLEFLGLIMVAACGLSILAAPRGKCITRFLLLAFCGQFLISSKGQAALAAPSVILLLVVLGIYHITGMRRSSVVLRVGSSLCLAALILYTGFFSVAIFQENQRKNSRHTEWHAFFNGALLMTDDPAQVLRDFDMDPRLLADVGKHSYLPDDQYLYPPLSEEAQREIFSKVNTLKLTGYYLTHPSMLLRALEHSAQAARAEMPDWFIYDGQWDTSAQQPVSRFSLWESLRPRFVPGHIVSYLLFFLAMAGYTLFLLIRQWKYADSQKLVLYAFYAGLLILSALQFPLSVLGNGLVDNTKQLYLHRLSFDIAFVFAAAEGTALLIRWVRRYESSAAPMVTAEKSEVEV